MVQGLKEWREDNISQSHLFTTSRILRQSHIPHPLSLSFPAPQTSSLVVKNTWERSGLRRWGMSGVFGRGREGCLSDGPRLLVVNPRSANHRQYQQLSFQNSSSQKTFLETNKDAQIIGITIHCYSSLPFSACKSFKQSFPFVSPPQKLSPVEECNMERERRGKEMGNRTMPHEVHLLDVNACQEFFSFLSPFLFVFLLLWWKNRWQKFK